MVMNTSAAFEHSRWLIQDRLRRKQPADKTGDEPERQYEQHDINNRPPEEQPEQPSCHPEQQGQDLSGNTRP